MTEITRLAGKVASLTEEGILENPDMLNELKREFNAVDQSRISFHDLVVLDEILEKLRELKGFLRKRGVE